MSYRLIYIFTIHDAQHEGYWKIGKTNFDSVNSYKQLPPNCAELNCAACDRIDQYTKTAMVEYDLQYTELARRTVTFPDGTTDTELFDDDDVHNVLYNSGFSARKFSNSNQDSEWFEVPLSVAIRAIQAVKEGRTALTAAEKSEGQISFLPQTVPAAPKKRAITLRDEQMDCVNQTLRVFRKQNSMLWNCKMRFGKTVTAYALIKKAGYQKVIVVTHRPVVEDGWRNDFDLIFGEGDNRAFLKKDRFDTDSSVYDAAMDARNDANLTAYQNSGKAFVYFASMQDLRGSQRADGKFDKNNAVFDMDWDLVIYDEAHEGTQTQRGQKVQSLLEAEKNGKAPKVLQLSGTPYNLMQKYENNVYTWDYVMEQKRKREWDTLHPGDHNPYADLPELRILTFDLGKSLPTSYRYETLEMAFNFTEFFRVWTGDPARDFRPLPAGAQVGDFVHEADVRSFLDLISSENPESNYPYSTLEYREMFRHTLWMVPGVKEASALSRLLKDHPVFGAYKVANVAGDGDAEMPYDNALTLVKQVIKANRYTITISCGKLTTGVTVPEWTAVMMLTGSASTAAPGYMQTIFRVQSAGVLDGKQKERCYVFDFAPDRALNVLSEVNRVTKRGKTNEEEYRKALGEFLNFCPVIAVDGTQMTEYSVPKMMRQIKRLTVDKAIKSGFDDESVYKQDTGMVMDEEDVELFHTLSDKLSEQKAAKKETKIHINNQGLTNEEYEEASKLSNKPKRERSKEDEELLKKLQDQRKERDKVIRLLRNVSIRLPLLIYGAKVDLTEEIHMADFIDLVDPESWQEFMPKGVSTALFRKLLKYYDEDVVSGAGLRIRRMAKAADELPPTERVKRIAEIFSHFRNPDKETVLTPWRVVNLHLSNMVGGYCFLNEQFDPQEVLEEPRLVDQGQVTEDIFLNPDARILEMNSKSGLYPLYMAYSLYAMKLPGPEDKLPLEQTQALWQETVEQQIFVLCKTRMAESITRRTLVGYQDWTVNTTYIPHLLERMENDPQRLAKKLQRTDTWGKEGQPMKFDAIVGNPPYQEMDGGGKGYSAKPVYNYFVGEAKAIEPHYISMITPSRWFSGGKGLDDFRAEMLQDKHLRKIVDYADNEALFSNVSIVGGVNYFLWDSSYNGDCEVTSIRGENAVTLNRDLSEYDIFIRNNNALQLIRRMEASNDRKMDDVVYPRNVFGISSDLRGQDNKDEKHQLALFSSQKSNSMAMSYISGDEVQKQHELIGKYKVIMGKVVPRGGEVGVDPGVGYRVTSTLQVLSPGSVFTDSYLLLAAFDSKAEAIHFAEYMCLRFPRFLLHETYSSMNISKQNFRFVPFLDYSKEWTDKELFKRYGCNEEEISMIESIIRPMEYVFHE
ncbi:DEAD/DEAH box helicase [Faecalibacterium sp. OM04-11BH]|nr:DEAD/DEAH box helicase [Faecalibacterium sp. OM04-11BH]